MLSKYRCGIEKSFFILLCSGSPKKYMKARARDTQREGCLSVTSFYYYFFQYFLLFFSNISFLFHLYTISQSVIFESLHLDLRIFDCCWSVIFCCCLENFKFFLERGCKLKIVVLVEIQKKFVIIIIIIIIIIILNYPNDV